MDTIFALATAEGKAGVSVVRISGREAIAAGTQLAGRLPKPRVAGLRRLTDADGDHLDEALVLVFPEGQSFTGEAVVELQLHGSISIVRAVLDALGQIPGLRLAEPGEFTRRALENGRLDLAQVEALSDLIDAETEGQRQQALRVFSGALGEKVAKWRTALIKAASLLEAVIDFADEEVPEDVSADVSALLSEVSSGIEQEIAGISAAERVRLGFEVAIVGAPNVGKSTLLNALAGRDAAITSEVAGTTRDVIEVRMDLSGLAVTLIDTAGLRETDDLVESLGISRARERAAQADLRVFLRQDEVALEMEPREGDLLYWTKADVTGRVDAISAKTGAGLDRVVSDITVALKDRAGSAGLATRERHRAAMRQSLEHLLVAAEIAGQGAETYDLAAEEVRIAIRRLEALVGHIDVENVLDEVFANFCLGK
ncbi:tRNA modification GTPase MnmE [Roseivivax sp. THAF40]|uniref:tRNA uridine-5-carboxymethylaminomethyl(34) synthesis GTPase MnmE n=1 Tax=unclassified Roseivivax TaxID=2639302 RepID=UPI0012685819|nr:MULTISPECIES: tRNA uridine-5-carboxymethylaminomethyl(34) synthesis GTPase MnmE [unclassified Roseivivax]QFS84727.1 tRNA modification GTPase MnmE [Roseivivax sp. THAF197b]QFT48554.1 tRNA modification GTPase MnmE [Roseivivax sp. THAF40]